MAGPPKRVLAPRQLFGLAISIVFCAMLAPSPVHASGGLCTRERVNGYFEEYGERDYQIDKAAFYNAIKPVYSVYNRTDGDHYRGTDAILDYWNANPRLQDPRWLAYILATSYLETGFRMFPVRETLRSKDEDVIAILSRDYERNPQRYRNQYWLPHDETGHSYFGRGYVQLTHYFNYQSADIELGVESRDESYYWNPDYVLDPSRSILIIYDGMIYGWYTGKHCLLQHFPPNQRGDWKNARRIINSLNKWQEIQDYGLNFLEAIEAATVAIEPATPIAPEPAPDPVTTPTPEPVEPAVEPDDGPTPPSPIPPEAAPSAPEATPAQTPKELAPPPPPPVFGPIEETAEEPLKLDEIWSQVREALERLWVLLAPLLAQLWEALKVAGAWVWDQLIALIEWIEDRQTSRDG